MGSQMQIADGTNVWTYHIDQRLYTKMSLVDYDKDAALGDGFTGAAANAAKILRRDLAGFTWHLKSATRLPDAELNIDGEITQCYVVRVTDSDWKGSSRHSEEKTIWIDKATETVAKTATMSKGVMSIGSVLAQDAESTRTYRLVELDRPIPDVVFTFTPPADAKPLDRFPDSVFLVTALRSKDKTLQN